MQKRTFALLFLLLLVVHPLRAQGVLPTRPFADWRTVETDHFVVHYPHEMAEWTLPLVTRLESVHTAVSNLVGNVPARRVTVVVVDPYNVANGMALPFLDAPAMILWPTPPAPRAGIGHHAGWAELLAVHEFGHLAHLTFPARNPRQRLLWNLLPVKLGPVTRRAPRWAIEGYATYIEGRLTASGRPYGAFRPAILRQWALEGRLPTYGQLSGTQGFLGGSMAYLVGSAFLEWLVEERGEESLNHLWRRLSARRARSFSEAFAGVYGGRPEDLYARFTVDLTSRALEVRQLLSEEGLAEGEIVQAREWATGDPALSPDGSRVAVVLGARDRPSRVVIWRTQEEPDTEEAARARERARQRDPLDVPDIQWRPRPRQAIATLHPVDGRPHEAPRFLPDGRWVLVTRSEPVGDGTSRPDLFLWDWEAGDLSRVTRGEGIREADPSPAGRTAVAVRCLNGICDLVRVALENGSVNVIHHGLPNRVFYRPRYSPNGRQIVVAVQEAGRWRLALTDDNGSDLVYVDPDDGASRYDASFLPDGRTLVCVSESGGIPNLELLDLAGGGTRPVTRVTGAAVAPDFNRRDGSLYFLRLHSRGVDVNRIHPDSVLLEEVVALDPRLAPAAPAVAAFAPDTLPRLTIARPRFYGTGPSQYRVLPGGTFATAGNALHATFARTDPVGRLTWLAQGSLGQDGAWTGGSLNLAWRRFRPALHADLFWARQQPSEQRLVVEGLEEFDAEYLGGTAIGEVARDFGVTQHRYRLGASLGRLQGTALDSEVRRLAFAEYRGMTRQISENRYFSQSLDLHAAMGATAGEDWRRAVATVGLGAGIGRVGMLTEFTYGTMRHETLGFERFLVGGMRPLLFDESILSQRVYLPAVPQGVLSGSEVAMLRTNVRLGLLHPYFWIISTDEAFQEWYRVVGLERELNLESIPLGRLPRIQAVLGAGYLLDEPFKERVRGYLSVRYRP